MALFGCIPHRHNRKRRPGASTPAWRWEHNKQRALFHCVSGHEILLTIKFVLRWTEKNIQISILRDFIDAILLLYHFVIVIAFSCACVEPISSSSFTFQPVTLSDREVISRLRNCLLALAAHKVLLYDTSVLYCYESSVQHQVGDISDRKRMWMYFFHHALSASQVERNGRDILGLLCHLLVI